MSNFKMGAKQDFFRLIILHISKCCEAMRDDCRRKTKNPLPNHEDKISNRLVARYLNVGVKGIRFDRESLEGFDDDTDTFIGKTDIRVGLSDYLNGNDKAYYTIEAKRLDGTQNLNNKYVSDGISRFVAPPSPKYSSYYGKSIMLGYVVRDIDVSRNTEEIDKLQHKLLVGTMVGSMSLICDDGKGFSHYQCSYQNLNIELTHLFYNFSDVIA